MGKKTGFLEYSREDTTKQPVQERVQHYKEFETGLTPRKLTTQAARCMDCGVPFCNGSCPVNNLIPEFNEYVYHNDWKAAYGTLQSTNNFPEVTGRVCPAPCETGCCAGLVELPVGIKMLEKAIIERAFEEGWVQPNKPAAKSGFKIAIIGSGPAGLAAAQQLNLAGHAVTVFEKNEVLGGLMVLGIPDFKLEKRIIERRLDLMREEGIEFLVNSHVGVNLSVDKLKEKFDVFCLTGGSEQPRALDIPGKTLQGVHFAMDFLKQQNRRVAGREIREDDILANGKNVVVIGGGDTGSDCVGTSIRQGALSVTQIEIMAKPPVERTSNNPWPQWPQVFTTSTSQSEGCTRDFSILTKEFLGKEKLEGIRCVRVEWVTKQEGDRPVMKEIADSEFTIKADIVFLAMGFIHPVHEGLIKDLDVELDDRGNVKTTKHMTSIPGIFAAGDMATGQSLIVRAISNGRTMAQAVDISLKGYTHLS